MGVIGEQRRVLTSLLTMHKILDAHAVSLFRGRAT